MTVKVRFAPSPTGRLHVGNIRAAIINWLFARKQGGQFVLRIDDTDLERSTKDHEVAIERDLAWLGLTWDERHNQSARFPSYQNAAERLKAQGRLYPAYETQDELAVRRRVQLARGAPPIYDRAALHLTPEDRAKLEAEGRRPHWRFRLEGKRVRWTDLIRGETEVDTSSLSDPVLIREDGAFLYTLPYVVEDMEMEITHVIRGEDHVTNTGAQIEIFEALGARAPEFAHYSLLIGADGEALSKRLGSLSVETLREQGFEPLAIDSHVAGLGMSEAPTAAVSLDVLSDTFDIGRLGRNPARYDPADLQRINAAVLHAMPYSEAQPRLVALDADLGAEFWETIRANLVVFTDVKLWAEVVRGPVKPVITDPAFLAEAAACLPDVLDWKAWTDAVKARTGAKGRALFMPLRQALTGLDHGPDMAALLPLIGQEAVKKRLAGEPA